MTIQRIWTLRGLTMIAQRRWVLGGLVALLVSVSPSNVPRFTN